MILKVYFGTMPNIIQNNKINLQNGVDIGEFEQVDCQCPFERFKEMCKNG